MGSDWDDASDCEELKIDAFVRGDDCTAKTLLVFRCLSSANSRLLVKGVLCLSCPQTVAARGPDASSRRWPFVFFNNFKEYMTL